MKKIFFMVVCLLSLTACKSSNNEAIIGEWSMSEKKFGVQMVYYYTFNENNSFIHNVCFYSPYVNDNPCDSGEAEWKGTYKIKDNIIYLTVKEEKQIKPNTIAGIPAKISDPPEKLIVDLNTMKLCDRDEGIDCDMPFEKN